MKHDINLMKLERQRRQIALMQAAPRCSATSKRTGSRCQAPALKSKKVCRFHGGRAGAPEGERNGRYRHGLRTKEMAAERRYVAELMRETRNLLKALP